MEREGQRKRDSIRDSGLRIKDKEVRRESRDHYSDASMYWNRMGRGSGRERSSLARQHDAVVLRSQTRMWWPTSTDDMASSPTRR